MSPLARAIRFALLPLLGAALPALAADPAPAQTLDRIVVIASRAPEPLGKVVATVSAIDRDTLDAHQATTLGDLVRYAPGIDVLGDSTRFGWQGFSIRGLDGNRVGMEVDGVPMAEAFSVGQFAAAGRDLVELGVVERVEILRGPASTLYGSDALAGVVAFRTRSPADRLAGVDGPFGFSTRASASGRDGGRGLSGAVAARGFDDRLQAMLLTTLREGHQADNHSSAHPANPLDGRQRGALAKLSWDAAAFGRWTVALDHGEGHVETDVRSLRFGPGRFSTTTDLRGDDRQHRDRISLDAEWTPARGPLDRSTLLLYGQRTDVRQDTAQTRLADRTTRFPSLRLRRFELQQDHRGLQWQGEAHTGEGTSIGHRHVFGVSFARTDYRGLRDGSEINLDTGMVGNVVLGEAFPVRDFPNSTARETGVFWQDEIGFGTRFALIPGLRWERYDLDARPDALFREDYPDIAVADIRRDAWTPKLGVRWQPGAHTTWFAQYARGFRAPPFGDVNIGLSLTLLNYEVRPNPDLRPERSRGLEAGWRWQSEGLRASVTAYRNRYRDLIESRANLGTDPATGATIFQSVNRARAVIEGLEAEATWTPGGTADWEFRAAAAWARGRDLARDQPLNSVAPGKLVLGASWAPATAHWGVEAIATGVARQPALDETAGPLFHAPGHGLFDVYAWWTPVPSMRVNLALLNAFDRRYWDWNTVRGVSATASDIAFYSRPGRSVSVSASFDW